MKMTIGKRLIKVREHFHLNQEQFSRVMGIKAFELDLMENEKKSITCMEIKDLDILLGVFPEWLTFGRGKMLQKKGAFFLRNDFLRLFILDIEMSRLFFDALRPEIMVTLDSYFHEGELIDTEEDR